MGTVIAAGDGVTEVAEGDRVLGCYCSACGKCFFCRNGHFHKCDSGRVFGHGKTLGSLQGAQADQVLVPHADLTLRRVPEGMSDDAALFAGDVMGTGYHAVAEAEVKPGDAVAVLDLGPVGLCAVQAASAAGASRVIAIDSVEDRLEMAESIRRRGRPPHRGRPARRGQGRNRGARSGRRGGRRGPRRGPRAGLPPDAQGRDGLAPPASMPSASRCTWASSGSRPSHSRPGHANVIGHVDRVLAMTAAGVLDPSPLVTHRMPLAEAAEAYAIYDRREALKIVMAP